MQAVLKAVSEAVLEAVSEAVLEAVSEAVAGVPPNPFYFTRHSNYLGRGQGRRKHRFNMFILIIYLGTKHAIDSYRS